MPKQLHYIRDFSGGVNSQRAARDINDNQSPFCQDVMGDRLGSLRTMGDGTADPRAKNHSSSAITLTTLGSTTLDASAGYGFKHFELDYDKGGAEEEGGEHYLALVSQVGVVNIWDYSTEVSGDGWDATPITAPSGAALDLGGASDVQANIIALDNGLRICDTNLDNSSTPKYYKYIKRSQLTTDRSGLYGNSTTLLPPTAGNAETTGYTNGAVNFDITAETDAASIGSWKDTDYVFAYSFVYDGNQESTLRVCPTTLADSAVTANKPFKVDVTVSNAGGATDFDARITGARIYWKYYDEAQEKIAEGEWNLFVDCDFTGGLLIADADVDNTETTVDSANDGTTDTSDLAVGMEVASSLGGVSQGTKVASITDADTFEMTNAGTASPTNTHLTFRRTGKQFGIRGKLSDEYTMWTNAAAGQYTATIILQDPSIDTYATINGYSSNEGKLYIGDEGDGYKASVFANRRMFVAGVKMTFEDGVQRQMLDRIMYSPVNKPDVFPLSNFIDVVQGDAEPYIKLDYVGNKLFAFKSDNLYVINIGNANPAGWYLESTHKGMGVLNPGAVFKTDFGLVWVNPNGLYAYQTGGGITELTEDKLLSGYTTYASDSVNYSSWGKLITAASIVGYSPKDKEIIVAIDPTSATNDTTFGGNGSDVVVYDIETKAFYFGLKKIGSGQHYTNFDYDWNGDLIYAAETSNNVTVKRWQSEPQNSTGIVYQTKDFDFGHPGLIKKIYKVYVTYKASTALAESSDIPFEYAADGSTSFTNFDTCTTGAGASTTQLAASASNFDVAVLGITTAPSVQSFAIRVENTTSGTLEINDIAIEYRLLPAKNVS